MGSEGLEPSPNRLRAGRSAARTSIPSSPSRVGPGGVEPPPPGYQPSVLPLNHGPRSCCPMGPEGFEPPPTGLKGRRAAATPRPRWKAPGPRFSSIIVHDNTPRFCRCQESGRPDSNRRSRAPRARGLARLSHALSVSTSSPCGNRTHLSALKGRYPEPIDERANVDEWVGGRSNPRLPGFNRPLDRLSYRPISLAGPTKRPGVFVTPGPRLLAMGCPWPGVRFAADTERAGSPTDRRIASRLDDPGRDSDARRTWTTSVLEGLGPVRLGVALSAGPSSCTLTDAASPPDVRANSRGFEISPRARAR